MSTATKSLPDWKYLEPSTGHVFFYRDSEVFEYKGMLFQAPLDSGFDPDGYRLGGVSNSYLRETTVEGFYANVQKLLFDLEHPLKLEDTVHPYDRKYFKPMSEAPPITKLAARLRTTFDIYLSIRNKDGACAIWTKAEDANQVLAVLGAVPGIENQSRWKEAFAEFVIPEASIPEAIETLKARGV